MSVVNPFESLTGVEAARVMGGQTVLPEAGEPGYEHARKRVGVSPERYKALNERFSIFGGWPLGGWIVRKLILRDPNK